MQSATKQRWEGRWDQFTSKVKRLWAEITDDDLLAAEGDYERALGVIKERTGETREMIEKKIEALRDDG